MTVNLKEHLSRQTFGSNWLLLTDYCSFYQKLLSLKLLFHISLHFSCHFLSFSGPAPPVAMPGLTSGLQNERGSFPLNVWARQRSCRLCVAGSHSSSSLKLLCGAES